MTSISNTNRCKKSADAGCWFLVAGWKKEFFVNLSSIKHPESRIRLLQEMSVILSKLIGLRRSFVGKHMQNLHRLIWGSLLITLLVLTVFSFTSCSKIKSMPWSELIFSRNISPCCLCSSVIASSAVIISPFGRKILMYFSDEYPGEKTTINTVIKVVKRCLDCLACLAFLAMIFNVPKPKGRNGLEGVSFF